MAMRISPKASTGRMQEAGTGGSNWMGASGEASGGGGI